ncbi:MAG: hypothetical protein DWQ05_15300 [Calditrichaeota bacterium]|nr:MAG: hypothetical protein DWQ05_15300 [Calditrichota bacterium]
MESMKKNTISDEVPVNFDYAGLRDEAMHHLEKMTGKHWTDFNAHDPGITILEQVCYALTDLFYRIDYEMPDLLASAGELAGADLFSPGQILTTHPVTLTDLRKLVLDIDGVKNAWIEKTSTGHGPLYFISSEGENSLGFEGEQLLHEEVLLRGLYNVFYTIYDSKEAAAIKNKVTQSLHANRPLCEDFEKIEQLLPHDIPIDAIIEIEAVDSPEKLMVEIYQRIADYISPPVRFLSLEQVLESGKSMDEIFDGPLLAHGFIDNEALAQAQRRKTLHRSDLINEFMRIKGVRAVRKINFGKGLEAGEWTLHLDPGKAARLDAMRSAITLERNQLPVKVDLKNVRATFAIQNRSTGLRSAKTWKPDLFQPKGEDREIAAYHSIQYQFPAAYGIGATGLPDSASPERKAQAKQLKAYLLFFDQFLANSFVQLKNACTLLSSQNADTQTYYSQLVADPALQLDGILNLNGEELQQLTESTVAENSGTSRKNRFLNHLLARFAEQFTDYALAAFESTSDEKLTRDKALFLQEYPQLSSKRSTATNYLNGSNSGNSSGLEQRIRRKLGIDETGEDFFMIEHILLRPLSEDQHQLIPLLTAPHVKDPFSLQVSFIFPLESGRFAIADFREFVERTIREETPAHIAAWVHWFSQHEMGIARDAFTDWLDKKGKFEKEKMKEA